MVAPKLSTPGPLRGRRGQETRAAILRAAERIFAEAGLAGARTDAIAAQARVNKALLYYYFKSKEALFQAVLEDHLKEFSRRAMDALSTDGPAGHALLRYVSTHFNFISARPLYPALFHRLMLSGGKPFARLVKDNFLPLSRKLVGLIERGIREGEFRRVDSHHAAISIVALTVFYFSAAPVVRVLGKIDPYAMNQVARRKGEVLKFIRYGLFRDPEANR